MITIINEYYCSMKNTYKEKFDINSFEKGWNFESEIREKLKDYFKSENFYLFHNLKITDKLQIDLLLITNKNIYIIECKNITERLISYDPILKNLTYLNKNNEIVPFKKCHIKTNNSSKDILKAKFGEIIENLIEETNILKNYGMFNVTFSFDKNIILDKIIPVIIYGDNIENLGEYILKNDYFIDENKICRPDSIVEFISQNENSSDIVFKDNKFFEKFALSLIILHNSIEYASE